MSAGFPGRRSEFFDDLHETRLLFEQRWSARVLAGVLAGSLLLPAASAAQVSVDGEERPTEVTDARGSDAPSDPPAAEDIPGVDAGNPEDAPSPPSDSAPPSDAGPDDVGEDPAGPASEPDQQAPATPDLANPLPVPDATADAPPVPEPEQQPPAPAAPEQQAPPGTPAPAPPATPAAPAPPAGPAPAGTAPEPAASAPQTDDQRVEAPTGDETRPAGEPGTGERSSPP